jgi:hypothetical protein
MESSFFFEIVWHLFSFDSEAWCWQKTSFYHTSHHFETIQISQASDAIFEGFDKDV